MNIVAMNDLFIHFKFHYYYYYLGDFYFFIMIGQCRGDWKQSGRDRNLWIRKHLNNMWYKKTFDYLKKNNLIQHLTFNSTFCLSKVVF